MKNKYKHIETALKDGYTIHGFRSGGGLRVLTMSKEDQYGRYYGESCNLQEALRILNDDIKAGGRKYEDVYGKIETNYWTGAYAGDNDPVDAWVCSGRKFDVHFENDLFIIDMTKKEDIPTPKLVYEKVVNELKTVYWKLIGKEHKREFKSEPTEWPNGSIACSTGPVGGWSGQEKNDEMIEFVRIAKGNSFKEALDNAITESTKKFEPDWYEIAFVPFESNINKI